MSYIVTELRYGVIVVFWDNVLKIGVSLRQLETLSQLYQIVIITTSTAFVDRENSYLLSGKVSYYCRMIALLATFLVALHYVRCDDYYVFYGVRCCG